MRGGVHSAPGHCTGLLRPNFSLAVMEETKGLRRRPGGWHSWGPWGSKEGPGPGRRPQQQLHAEALRVSPRRRLRLKALFFFFLSSLLHSGGEFFVSELGVGALALVVPAVNGLPLLVGQYCY